MRPLEEGSASCVRDPRGAGDGRAGPDGIVSADTGSGGLALSHSRTQTLPGCRTGAGVSGSVFGEPCSWLKRSRNSAGGRSAQRGPCSEAQGVPPSSLKAGLTAPSAARRQGGQAPPSWAALLSASSSDTGCPMETAVVRPQNLGFRIWSLLGNSSHRKSVDVDVPAAEEVGRWESTRQQRVGRGRAKGRVRLLAQHVHRDRQREPLEQACQTRGPWAACLVNTRLTCLL